MPKLTANRLRQLLDYDPRTGRFTWLINGRGRFTRIGQRAGTPRKNGRIQICVDGQIHLASRLAFLWVTGRWPRQLVDHRNCNPSDDRWCNLRAANFSQNAANAFGRQSAVPFKGVTRNARGKPFSAQIRVKYQTIRLGCFDTPEAAHAAYVAAANRHFGEFARRQ